MKVFPNAKINIGLNVVEKRADGYHNIETVFCPIALTDELEIRPSAEKEDYHFSPTGIDVLVNPEKNLIIKALRLLKADFKIPPIDIFIHKKIPFGAGLGGGSADAAFTLKCLNELASLHLSDDDLEKYAAQIGADCPVFIRNKPVFASATGNVFSPVNISLKGFYLLLVKPDIPISTPMAYSLVAPQPSQYSLLQSVELPVEEWKNAIVNDFEKPVFALFPEIQHIKETLYGLGAKYAAMSGSGSAVYGIFDTENIDLQLFEKYFTTIIKLK